MTNVLTREYWIPGKARNDIALEVIVLGVLEAGEEPHDGSGFGKSGIGVLKDTAMCQAIETL